MGEVSSAVPLLRELREHSPAVPIYLSTSTVAGRRIAESQATPLVDGIFYAPLDVVSSVRRTLRQIRPSLLVILETEIWPNLLMQAHLSESAIAFVNARISERAWPRYRRFAALFRPILRLTDLVLTQSDRDTERFLHLGALPQRVRPENNLKYAANTLQNPTEVNLFGAHKVWIAASTVGPNEPGSLKRHSTVEEEVVLEAFDKLRADFPHLLLILAPRQPARFDEAAERLRRSGVPFLRRTQQKADASANLPLPGVLLLDTLGELAGFYSRADAVFVGGSIAPRGGHNILEPAFAGVPIVVGPHMHNFQSIYQDFRKANAVVEVASSDELAQATRLFLGNPDQGRAFGQRAQQLARQQTGVAQRVSARLLATRSLACYRAPRPLVLRMLLGLLALVWTTGGIEKRRRGEQIALNRTPIGRPAISVGGITVGGSGKTPFANYLAAQLRSRGFEPAILTRGYRRRWPAKHIVTVPGVRLPSSFTGDEAQIFLRSGAAFVGIGADRYETARLLLSTYPEVNALVLDDGFQHARIPRDLDLVLIDALDPLGGGDVVPLGRLREPLEALKRAEVFVVMRSESQAQQAAIAERLAEWNPDASVFSAHLEILGWRTLRHNHPVTVEPGRRVYAFCGLGNPKSFWGTLENLRLDVAGRFAFGDHHSYTPSDLKMLRHDAARNGATLLVTTEKDRANLPPSATEALGDIEAAWLEIGVSMPDEDAFFRLLESRLHRLPAR